MLAKYSPLIIAVLVVVIVVLGGYLYSYTVTGNMQPRQVSTITTTTTITQTVTATVTVLRTVTLTKVMVQQPTQGITTITVPVTTTLTVTVPPTPKPAPTTIPVNTTPSRLYGVVGNIEYLAWSTAPMPDISGSFVFPVPRNVNITMLASNIASYIRSSESKKISLANTAVNIKLTSTQNLALLLTLFRGNPCTYYRVEIVDGNLSDGLGIVRVVKYSTSDVCIQVVPPDSQFNILLLLSSPGTANYKLVVEYNDGVKTTTATINVVQG